MIKANKIILIIAFVLCRSLYANVEQVLTQAKLTIESTSTTLSEGEVFEGRIEIWPLDNLNLEAAKTSFDKKEITPFLHAFQAKEIYFSPNNEELLVVEGTFTFIKPIAGNANNVFLWNWNDKIIKFRLPENLKVTKTTEASALTYWEFQLKDQVKAMPAWIISSFVILVTLFLIVVFYLFHRHKHKVKKSKIDWNSFFNEVENREKIEETYTKREELKKDIGESINIDQLSRLLEEIQYKRDWTTEEYQEASSIYHNIRKEVL